MEAASLYNHISSKQEILNELLKLQIEDGGISEDIDKYVSDYYVIFEYVSLIPAYFILVILPLFSVALILGSVGKVRN
jgi:hypothetical protein